MVFVAAVCLHDKTGKQGDSSCRRGMWLVTSSVTDMRLKAWMAASCTDKVVAGCLMHLSRVVLIAGSVASIASPMLPTTWTEYESKS